MYIGFDGRISYDPETGLFTRLKKTHGKHTVGEEVGYLTGMGYKGCNLMGKFYYMHRLAWFLVHGEWPDVIDHINGNPLDNRISNLRNVTQAVNMSNAAKRFDNKSGFSGISWDKLADKWRVQLRGKYVGIYETIDMAKDARDRILKSDKYFTERHGE